MTTLIEDFEMAYRNLQRRKTRTLLTMLGIVIGVGAIVSLMSIGAGLNEGIKMQLAPLADKIIISSQGGMMGFGGAGVPASALVKLKGLPHTKAITPRIQQICEISHGDKQTFMLVEGVDTKIMSKYGNVKMREGRYLSPSDKYTAVLGGETADWLMEQLNFKLRNKIHISPLVSKGISYDFKVVGIQEPVGMMESQSYAVQIPLDTAQEMFLMLDEVSSVWIIVDDPFYIDDVADEIKKRLGEGYDITTSKDIMETTEMITSMTQATFLGVASIALIVAALGIMNTMLMSVMERTREIGTMKAIGATKFAIMRLFLIEALMISLFGGIVGIILGILTAKGIAYGISIYLGIDFFKAIIELKSIILGISVALIVGAVSGIYPAKRAADLSPVEALRYVG